MLLKKCERVTLEFLKIEASLFLKLLLEFFLHSLKKSKTGSDHVILALRKITSDMPSKSHELFEKLHCIAVSKTFHQKKSFRLFMFQRRKKRLINKLMNHEVCAIFLEDVKRVIEF